MATWEYHVETVNISGGSPPRRTIFRIGSF